MRISLGALNSSSISRGALPTDADWMNLQPMRATHRHYFLKECEKPDQAAAENSLTSPQADTRVSHPSIAQAWLPLTCSLNAHTHSGDGV